MTDGKNKIKERLKRYTKLLDEIDVEERRKKALDRNGSITARRAAAGVCDSLQELMSREQQEYEELIEIINALPCIEQRQAILARYMERQPWERVTEILFGHKEDYTERAESYKRRVTRIHGSALVSANMIISK